MHCPQAKRIRLVQDNLNTHDGASLYETFSPAEARRILDKIEFHYTPKHGITPDIKECNQNLSHKAQFHHLTHRLVPNQLPNIFLQIASHV